MRGIAMLIALLVIGAMLASPFSVLSGMRGVAGYQPLHMLFETLAIVVSMLVFAAGWHAYNRNLPGNIVLLACAFFGVGLLDFAHMLSYAGMPDFVTPSDPEKAINFWLAARSLAAVALFAVAIMPWRPSASAATRYKLLAAVVAVTAFTYWLVLFQQKMLPRTFIPGLGLTAFKIAWEYAIIALNLAAAFALWMRMHKPQPFDAAALFGAVCVMALSEFFFTLYANVTDIYNLTGHVYKGIAYLFLYRAIFVAAIENPYRQLQLSKIKLRGTLDAIPDQIWLKDTNGVYLECNAMIERLFGAKREAIVGKTDYDFLDKDLADFLREHDRKAMAAGKPSVNEEWLTYADDGHSALFETVKTPMYDKAGKLIGVLGIARDITERKQAEEALRRSEAMLYTLYNSTSDAVMLLDENGFFDCNKATLAMFGCATKGEFCSKHPADLSPPEQPCGMDSMTLAERKIAAAMKTGRQQFEWMYRRADTGQHFHADVLLNSMVLDKTILQMTVRDITERKHAEELAHQFGSLLQSSFDEIYMFDACSLHFLLTSKGAEENLGYSSDELNLLTPLDLNPSFTEQSFEKLAAPLRCGEEQSLFFEAIHRRKDGTDYPVETHLQLMHGQQPVFMAIVQDTSRRKRNEARIERLSRTYRLLSRVNEAIVRAEDKYKFFEAICNAAIESGLFRFAWIGMLDETWVIPVAHAGVEEGYLSGKFGILLDDERTGNGPTGRAIREGTHIVCQSIEDDPGMEPWRNEALKRGYQSSAAFPVREEGSIAGSINVYSAETHFFTPDIIQLMLELTADISFALDVFAGRKRRELAENEIRQLNIELERRVAERTHQLEMVNKELEAFCYSVSHDLRAPLRSIDGFSQVLLKKHHGQLDATGKDYLERVRRSSQHMGHLIDDMLQLSQVTRGSLKRDLADLSAIAQQAAEELRKAHPRRQVRFILQQGLAIHGDAGLLRIAMDNLLGNAWKYTGKKTQAEIEFGARDIDGTHTFFVRDNGAGFNMEYAQKLFGAFQRLHGASEFEGTGIGLATVQRIVHRHHGKVWAEAKEGQGATFYFTLPQRERET